MNTAIKILYILIRVIYRFIEGYFVGEVTQFKYSMNGNRVVME